MHIVAAKLDFGIHIMALDIVTAVHFIKQHNDRSILLSIC